MLFACACGRAVKVVFIFALVTALLFADPLMLMWFACTDAAADDVHDDNDDNAD